MRLELSYDNDKLIEEIINNYPNLVIDGHDERTLKGKKASFEFKGHWAARANPFAILFNDEDKVIHAFYSEVNECTFDNINGYLVAYE